MPVKVSKAFWKVHPFSDAFLRKKKKSEASSRGHKPFPPTLLPEDQPAALPPWSARDAPVSLSIVLSLSWGVISAPRTATAMLRVVGKHQPVLQQLHLCTKRERSTSKTTIQKLWRRSWKSCSCFFVLKHKRKALKRDLLTLYSPVHHTTFQFWAPCL